MSRPDEKTERSSQTGMRGLLDFEMSEVKLKRKRRMLTMCEVCNIQLNSSTQAQIHYNGKTHQRRLRQANQAKTGAGARKVTAHTMQFRLDSLEPTSPYNKTMKRSPVQGGALLKSLPVQDLKRFLPLRANISSPLNLFSNFGLMDPVQKAVISHTFSIAQSLKKKQIITCNICHLRFNSTIQAEAHYKGHKHAQKLKAIDKLKSKQRILEKSVCRERGRKKPEDESVSERTEPSQASKPEDVGTDGISITSSSKKLCESKHLSESPAPVLPLDPRLTCDLEPVAKGNGSWRNCSRSLQCPICKVTVNSGSQLEDHYKGFKHRLMLRRRCTLPLKKWARKVDASGAIPCPKHLSLNAAPSDQSHHCNVCDVDVNSEAQLQQHISSRRHRGRATGKSQKIKFNNSVFTTKLTLQKELSKTLTSSLPTSALTPASLFAMPTGPFCLSHAHPLPAIIHTPLFNPTLFRPALGPLRPTHGPIVFSPY